MSSIVSWSLESCPGWNTISCSFRPERQTLPATCSSTGSSRTLASLCAVFTLRLQSCCSYTITCSGPLLSRERKVVEGMTRVSSMSTRLPSFHSMKRTWCFWSGLQAAASATSQFLTCVTHSPYIILEIRCRPQLPFYMIFYCGR